LAGTIPPPGHFFSMPLWLEAIEAWLLWLPSWVADALALTLAVGGSLLAHGLIERGLGRFALWRSPYLVTLIERVHVITRLAALLLALAATLRVVSFAPLTARLLSQLLLVAFILLVGWTASLAVTLATDRYIGRFKIEPGNPLARKHVTQVRILRRTANVLVGVVTVAAALMSFDAVRTYGVSLFASAGVAGLVVGLAARPLLANLIAGFQIALTQPIRIEDTVVVENEFGWIEEITGTYVVVRLWDWRRLVVPLSYFIEKPFQNWSREAPAVLGSVYLHVDYTAPVDRIRAKAEALTQASKLWDGKVFNLQVWEATDQTLQLRVLVSAADAGASNDLKAEIREKLVAYLRDELPEAMPRQRTTLKATAEEPAWARARVAR
jgi:small-conductance mechanosensitive channel